MGWFDYILNPTKIWEDYTGASANETNIQATRETNETNRQIAAETNQLQRDLFNQQTQTQWDMWHAQNAYNTPAAQRARLQQAGINPILGMMSNGDVGNASSMTAPQAPQMQRAEMRAPHVDPLNLGAVVNPILGSMNTVADISLKGQQTQGLRIENSFGAERAMSQIFESNAHAYEMLSRRDLNHWQALDALNTLQLNRMTYNEMVAGRKLGVLEQAVRINQAEQEINESLSRQHLNEFSLLAQKSKLPIELNQLQAVTTKIYSEIDNIRMNTSLTKAQAYESCYRAVKTQFETVGIAVNNEFAAKFAEKALQTKIAELRKLNFENEEVNYGPFRLPSKNKINYHYQQGGYNGTYTFGPTYEQHHLENVR